MKNFLLIISIFLLSNFKIADNAGRELLNKTIAYHDPTGNWAKLKEMHYSSKNKTERKKNN